LAFSSEPFPQYSVLPPRARREIGVWRGRERGLDDKRMDGTLPQLFGQD
jgi:hypothetical protein